ncbi:MAG: imidazole glycerol phosphate synthase subunit HisH [Rikenellaceae bacterium]|nr:imidazole glycerol phosphate synthase subunit HisH [Rikenellaceae bacterium]
MITIIDYGTGNLESVKNALNRLNAEYILSSDHETIRNSERVLLPGVGEAYMAMDKLRERGLPEVIKSLTQPVLGICIGLQLLCSHSEESDTECIGVFENKVKKLRSDTLKIPHMGWNDIYDLRSPLFKGVEEYSYVYYVHSYAAEKNENTIAVTDYGIEYSGALNRDNFYGVQFHPEKSSTIGEKILKNFLEL